MDNIEVIDFFGDRWTVVVVGEYQRNIKGLVTYRAIMLNHTVGEIHNRVRLPILTDWFMPRSRSCTS